MTKEQKLVFGVIGGLVLLAAAYLFLPVWQASQRYETATGSLDRCNAARELAFEWGSLGFGGKREEWTSKAALACLIARHNPT